jgi:hypothetical protein
MIEAIISAISSLAAVVGAVVAVKKYRWETREQGQVTPPTPEPQPPEPQPPEPHPRQPQPPEPHPRQPKRIRIIGQAVLMGAAVWLVLSILGAAAALGISRLVDTDGPTTTSPQVTSTLTTPPSVGRISSPKSGQHVDRTIAVEGTLSRIPSGHHAWIAVQIGDLLFPKERVIPSTDQRWTVDIVEGGNPPNGRFSVILLMVDGAGNQRIMDWLGQADYSGLRSIPGSVRLDVVNLVLR